MNEGGALSFEMLFFGWLLRLDIYSFVRVPQFFLDESIDQSCT